MDTKNALFIVNSPFQALCALEAIHHYGIQNPQFVHYENEIIRAKTVPLLQSYGYSSIFITPQKLGTLALIKSTLKTIQHKYSTIFIGDWFDYGQYVIAICVAKSKAEFIYLDDGNSTLSIPPPVSRVRYRTKNEHICYIIFGIIERIRHIRNRFFTLFNLIGCSVIVEKNDFKSLSNNNKVKTPKDIYIIGTNSSTLEFRDSTYATKLLQLAQYISINYPTEKVFYCPHRGDSNDYSSLIQSFGWKMFDTEISVEVDFVKKSIYPKFILGFGSTALLTLKNIYSKSQVSTIYMVISSKQIDCEYRRIEEYYSENGISILRI